MTNTSLALICSLINKLFFAFAIQNTSILQTKKWIQSYPHAQNYPPLEDKYGFLPTIIHGQVDVDTSLSFFDYSLIINSLCIFVNYFYEKC